MMPVRSERHLFQAQLLSGLSPGRVLHVFIELGVDQLEAVIGIVYLVLIDALLFAIGASNTTHSPLIGLLELVVVLALFGVRLLVCEVSILVRFAIWVGIVHVAEEVEEVGELLLDICEEFGCVLVEVGVGDASSGFSYIGTIYVRILFLQFCEMHDTSFGISAGNILHFE